VRKTEKIPHASSYRQAAQEGLIHASDEESLWRDAASHSAENSCDVLRDATAPAGRTAEGRTGTAPLTGYDIPSYVCDNLSYPGQPNGSLR